MLNKNGRYAAYLRKSRLDEEAELSGAGDTLKKHEVMINALAKKLGIHISKIYREVVSGELIAIRPEMQKLLSEVGNGSYDGVLVIEIERLGRGDSIDQGIIVRAFKYSNTKIITPHKIFDPNNRADAQHLDFNLFISKLESDTIKERMQRGKQIAAMEGKFIGGTAPFGYKKVKIERGKGWTLEPIEEQAKIIKYIFKLYTEGEDGVPLGSNAVMTKLNAMSITPLKSDFWHISTVEGILRNPVYAGKIAYMRRPYSKKIVDGEVKVSRPRALENQGEENWVKGLHEPIISEDTWNLANERWKNKPKYEVIKRKLSNPFAGLVECSICGRSLVLKHSNKRATLVCSNPKCNCISIKLELFESLAMEALNGYLNSISVEQRKNIKMNQDSLELYLQSANKLAEEIKTVNEQITNAYDYFERKIYSEDVFTDRINILNSKLNELLKSQSSIKEQIEKLEKNSISVKDYAPKLKKVLAIFKKLEDPKNKNDVLKSVIDKIIYEKRHKLTANNKIDGNVSLKIRPKNPW